MTSAPRARSLTCATNSRTTLKLTSASSSARRISRMAASMSSAVSLPWPLRLCMTPCRRSVSDSNMRAFHSRSPGSANRSTGACPGSRAPLDPAGTHRAGPAGSLRRRSSSLSHSERRITLTGKNSPGGGCHEHHQQRARSPSRRTSASASGCCRTPRSSSSSKATRSSCARPTARTTGCARWLDQVRGSADIKMTTDEIMAPHPRRRLTRARARRQQRAARRAPAGSRPGTSGPPSTSWPCATHGRLVINHVVYAEVSVGFSSIETLDAKLPRSLYERARRYRGRRRSSPARPSWSTGVPAAHDALRCPISTSAPMRRSPACRSSPATPARYRTYFPTVELIAPDA